MIVHRGMGLKWLRGMGRSGLPLAAPAAAAVQGVARPLSTKAAAGAGSSSDELTSRIKDDMKAAMKARDAPRLEAIRFLSAAVKQREIELRESGKQVTDTEVLSVIRRLAKQRQDSIEQYNAGGRGDLATKEAVELALLQGYLPVQMSREELQTVVAAVVAETGASSIKEMGKVMKEVGARTAGRADNKAVSELVKAALASAAGKK